MTRKQMTPRCDEINRVIDSMFKELAEKYPPNFYSHLKPERLDRALGWFNSLEQSVLYDSDALVMKKIEWYKNTMLALFREEL